MAARVRTEYRPIDGAVAAALLPNVATPAQMLLLIAAIDATPARDACARSR
ncbi:hypothetical protein [Ralstonia sp. UNC404CL21Col]|uniref:hypothetical protein n=1 Tax=Ralstonia sp. UNC404CL21Col TaxID=1380362 RepID=UPI000B249588|nr:hypothetical protein [Ralstonia sp. UNC404CL21Col]